MKMSNKNKGFTLLELATIVAIIAITTAIAVPSYRYYVRSSQTTETLLAYDAAKAGMGAALSQGLVTNCSDIANAVSIGQNLANTKVGIGFNAVGGANSQGYSAAFQVCAASDQQGNLGVEIARAAHDGFARTQQAVSPGAVLTDNLVSFSVPIGNPDVAACLIPTATGNAGISCGGSALAVAPAQAQPSVTQPSSQQNPPAVAAQPAVAAVAAGPLPPEAFEGCPDGMVKGSNGQCRALVCREEVVPDPTPAQRAIGDLYSQLIGTDPTQLRPPPSAPTLPPESVRFGADLKSAPGMACHQCGEKADGIPCTDLDLVLEFTYVCPNQRPVCGTTINIKNGSPEVYKYCESIDSAVKSLAQNSGCTEGIFGVTDAPGAVCSHACYGNECNLFDAGVSLAGTTRTVCE